MKRANVGCGSVLRFEWKHFDLVSTNDAVEHWDIRTLAPPPYHRRFDYIVMNHVLSDLDHHELVPALTNVRLALREGGTLRVMVPNLMLAIDNFNSGNEDWFPQDHRTGDLDAKFCTFLTWFGTVRSVFTQSYLIRLLMDAGYDEIGRVPFGETGSGWPEIVDLDDRQREALIFEAQAT